MNQPLLPVDPRGLESIAESLLSKSTEDEGRSDNPSHSTVVNAKTYVILPGKTHGSYSYPDLLVATERTYLGNTWFQAHESLAREGGFMLTLRQYVDFLQMLTSGRKVYDGRGRELDSSKKTHIIKDIMEKVNPWRSEWLDADFKVVGGVLHINYAHKVNGSNLIPQKSEPLQGGLMIDKKPGINLEYWLNHATPQGLPPTDNPGGELWYRYPLNDNNSVAGFFAFSDGANLSCSRNPQSSVSGLGVRVVRKK